MKTLSNIAIAAAIGLVSATPAKALNGFGAIGSYDTSGPEYYIIDTGSGPLNILRSDNPLLNTTYGLTTYADQGPYEGSDDTYVAVINKSSSTLSSFTLTGPVNPSTPLFGFDGDGINLYAPTIPNNANDTTGYGGPQAWFTGISLDQYTGTVNFIGGIAPGGQTYFSLESALNQQGGTGGGGVTGTVPDAGSTMAMLSAGLIGLGLLRRRIQG